MRNFIFCCAAFALMGMFASCKGGSTTEKVEENDTTVVDTTVVDSLVEVDSTVVDTAVVDSILPEE